MIQVEALSKYYGTHRAVDRITFEVAPGEIVGFLGPNGAGKTTTLRVLTCYHPATSGRAMVAGFDVFRQSRDVRRRVGYLPETVPLYPEMRVTEYLRFRGRLRGIAARERRVAMERVIERCWLQDVATRPIGQLSKGYRQRVGLADALLHQPPVLILDEPTVGLDPSQIRETRGLVRALAGEHTVLLSSHILPEVEATCQRLVIINRGRLVASGTPAELREQVAETSRLVVEVQAPAEAARAALAALEGVGHVETEASGDWTRLRIEVAGDLREAVAAACVQRGWCLRELRREIASLEDFFVQIISGARAAPAEAVREEAGHA